MINTKKTDNGIKNGNTTYCHVNVAPRNLNIANSKLTQKPITNALKLFSTLFPPLLFLIFQALTVPHFLYTFF